ncbi:MAG: hypothetical protein IPN79_10025 [Saprospiraceae bacterium]|nr:hypothetical protein [Saprospiraceae bacterium]
MEVQNEIPAINFPIADKEAWIQKIVSDMKGNKGPEDFMVETEGLVLDPFQTINEVKENYLPLDRIFDEAKTGIFFEITNALEDNKTILSFLEKGASCLYLDINKAVDPAILFFNIHLEYLFVCIRTNDINVSNSFHKYADTAFEDKSLQVYILLNGKCNYPSKTEVYDVDMSMTVIKTFIQVLKKAEIDIKRERPLRCIFIFELGKNFLFTVAALRAFRVLWENLISELGFEGDIPLVIGVLPKVEVLSEDSNQALTEWTYMALSGFLGNTDMSFSLAKAEKTGHNYSKTAFLAQQILLEEGKVGHVKDPLAGSLFIEQATQKIASQVWENLF